ncbi:hypothetical protein PFISCL1PPCAC_17735, partial [Pristionchus fissidentatus]
LVCLPLLIWSLIYQADRLADQSNLQFPPDGTEGQSIRTRRTAGTGEKTEEDYSDLLNEEVKAKLDEAVAELAKKKEEFARVEKDLAMKQQDKIQKKMDYEEKKGEWERLEAVAKEKEKLSDRLQEEAYQAAEDLLNLQAPIDQVTKLMEELVVVDASRAETDFESMDPKNDANKIEGEIDPLGNKIAVLKVTILREAKEEKTKKNKMDGQLLKLNEAKRKQSSDALIASEKSHFDTAKGEYNAAVLKRKASEGRLADSETALQIKERALPLLRKLADAKDAYDEAQSQLAAKTAAEQEAALAAAAAFNETTAALDADSAACIAMQLANETATAAESAVETASKKLNEAKESLTQATATAEQLRLHYEKTSDAGLSPVQVVLICGGSIAILFPVMILIGCLVCKRRKRTG